MTREEILALDPGMDMDREIARRFFAESPFKILDWSTSWADAGTLLESLPPSMFGHEISLGRVGQEWGVYYDAGAGREMFVALAATAPLAICRAKLLLALEDER
jgi:hypothetical protein